MTQNNTKTITRIEHDYLTGEPIAIAPYRIPEVTVTAPNLKKQNDFIKSVRDRKDYEPLAKGMLAASLTPAALILGPAAAKLGLRGYAKAFYTRPVSTALKTAGSIGGGFAGGGAGKAIGDAIDAPESAKTALTAGGSALGSLAGGGLGLLYNKPWTLAKSIFTRTLDKQAPSLALSAVGSAVGQGVGTVVGGDAGQAIGGLAGGIYGWNLPNKMALSFKNNLIPIGYDVHTTNLYPSIRKGLNPFYKDTGGNQFANREAEFLPWLGFETPATSEKYIPLTQEEINDLQQRFNINGFVETTKRKPTEFVKINPKYAGSKQQEKDYVRAIKVFDSLRNDQRWRFNKLKYQPANGLAFPQLYDNKTRFPLWLSDPFDKVFRTTTTSVDLGPTFAFGHMALASPKNLQQEEQSVKTIYDKISKMSSKERTKEEDALFHLYNYDSQHRVAPKLAIDTWDINPLRDSKRPIAQLLKRQSWYPNIDLGQFFNGSKPLTLMEKVYLSGGK